MSTELPPLKPCPFCGWGTPVLRYRLSDLRRLLAQPTTQTTLSFMENHPLIRDMREYTAFLELLYPENEPAKEAAQ